MLAKYLNSISLMTVRIVNNKRFHYVYATIIIWVKINVIIDSKICKWSELSIKHSRTLSSE